jgi:hypothetical protein
MTQVKLVTKLVEKLIYYLLQGLNDSDIINKISKDFHVPLDEMTLMKNTIQRLRNVTQNYANIFYPNNVVDPDDLPQNSWFDLYSDKFAINVKWGVESTANSRIRDLTKKAMTDIIKIVDEKYQSCDATLTYENFRNGTLRKISSDVKKRNFPININFIEDLCLKLTYLVCMNFVGSRNNNKNIFFINFNSNLNSKVYQVAFTKKIFKVENFIKNMSISFSTNKQTDPHKQTVKYHINNLAIGFLELRTNGRAMLHLRESEGHWDNINNTINKYLD